MLSDSRHTKVADEALNDGQLQSLPWLASAKTVAQGIRIIIRKGLVSDRAYFYRKWWRQPMYKKRVIEERQLVHGHVKEVVENEIFAHAEGLTTELLRVAYAKPGDAFAGQKIRAIEDCLLILGVEISRATKVDFSVNTHIREKQGTFKELIVEGIRRRDGTLGEGVPRIPNGRKVTADV